MQPQGSRPQPLVSVIIPTRERVELLREALASVASQTYPAARMEVLVVNDGGPPLASTLEGAISGLQVLDRACSLGPAGARRFALERARGEFVAYLDDDDLWLPDHVERLVAALSASAAPVVAYTAAIDRLLVRRGQRWHGVQDRETPGRPFDRDALLVANYIPLICVMHTRARYLEVGGFDPSLSCLEDWELLLRLTAGAGACWVEAHTAVYRHFQGQQHVNALSGGGLEVLQRIYRAHPVETSQVPRRAEHLGALVARVRQAQQAAIDVQEPQVAASGDELASTLERLSRERPRLFEALQPALKRGVTPAPLAQPGAAWPDLEELRGTTLVCLGTDARLPDLLARAGGETNLIVVEDDPDRLLALVTATPSEALFDASAVRWIAGPAMVEAQPWGRFLLGNLELLLAARPPSQRLARRAVRRLREAFVGLARRPDDPTTYLVMVTFGRLALTRLTLRRLRVNSASPLRLVIVDNDSADGTRAWLAEHGADYPFIERVLPMPRNLGVGRALNNGLIYALARSQRVGRIDNDMLVPPYWLRDLRRVLDSELRPAIVGGVVSDEPNARVYLDRGRSQLVDDLKVHLVENVGGCCNLYRPGLFAELGFFAEVPLYGFEDGGLCREVRRRGELIAAVDNVKLEHLTSIIPDAPEYDALKHALERVSP